MTGWVFDNLQTTMNYFSEALYCLHVELVVHLDHYNSIELEPLFPSNILGTTLHWNLYWNHAEADTICLTLK